MATKMNKPVTRQVEIITDNRDTARPRDKYVVTMSTGGVELKPIRCGQDKAVFVAWSTVLNQARLAEGLRSRKK